jgi:lysozyme
MKTSLTGILAIINEEALVLSTYRDSAGVLTIGVGHTAMAGGMAPKPGGRITIEQAIALFAADLAKFERRVAASLKRTLAPHEFDALVSFDFNTGAIAGGTVDDKLDKGDIDGALATLQ